MLDPWYNKGVGGVRADYIEYITSILEELAEISDHIYLWGFPEVLARFVERIPRSHQLTAWLTWYYKNNPSVIRGWRSAQNACLHLSTPSSKLYPEHFLNSAQLELKAKGKLRYMPGPTSVIESPLLVGFVGRKEQTGHPAQKPQAVYEPLIKMSTKQGDLVFDPMCGSGTTGAVCRLMGRNAVLADISDEYVEIVRKRLMISPENA
ncbi:DNA-methyltransferase [Leptothrix discophora]|uniref:Methyltransferase n=1 Tax=Leptothrix discophora TaxID=89 RepID=A0ABT9G0H7_LEPDI|nr:site-specific DNA-methyltransferase [Leptothrix discophora]MDP4299703.1 site-specific DNA-methyltransferase [Leptothrix discophora]